MKTYFYNRSLVPLLGPVPEPLMALDDAFDTFFPRLEVRHRYVGLAENLARRRGDVEQRRRAIVALMRSNANPFETALFIASDLVAYHACVKSFLDAVAITLNELCDLGLKGMAIDLCRDRLWAAMKSRKPEEAVRYKAHTKFFNEVRLWRNYSSHTATPFVIVSGPTSAHRGKDPSQVRREDVQIVMAADPDLSALYSSGEIVSPRWMDPVDHLDTWEPNIASVLRAICMQFASHVRRRSA